jgi:hypothetical protein
MCHRSCRPFCHSFFSIALTALSGIPRTARPRPVPADTHGHNAVADPAARHLAGDRADQPRAVSPNGCPIAIEPPFGFSRSIGIPSVSRQYSTCDRAVVAGAGMEEFAQVVSDIEGQV